jgi:hypothetical protein
VESAESVRMKKWRRVDFEKETVCSILVDMADRLFDFGDIQRGDLHHKETYIYCKYSMECLYLRVKVSSYKLCIC